jgi:hypothetical protein
MEELAGDLKSVPVGEEVVTLSSVSLEAFSGGSRLRAIDSVGRVFYFPTCGSGICPHVGEVKGAVPEKAIPGMTRYVLSGGQLEKAKADGAFSIGLLEGDGSYRHAGNGVLVRVSLDGNVDDVALIPTHVMKEVIGGLSAGLKVALKCLKSGRVQVVGSDAFRRVFFLSDLDLMRWGMPINLRAGLGLRTAFLASINPLNPTFVSSDGIQVCSARAGSVVTAGVAPYYFKHDASTVPGNSGAPGYNNRGQVAYIHIGSLRGENRNLCISVSQLYGQRTDFSSVVNAPQLGYNPESPEKKVAIIDVDVEHIEPVYQQRFFGDPYADFSVMAGKVESRNDVKKALGGIGLWADIEDDLDEVDMGNADIDAMFGGSRGESGGLQEAEDERGSGAVSALEVSPKAVLETVSVGTECDVVAPSVEMLDSFTMTEEKFSVVSVSEQSTMTDLDVAKVAPLVESTSQSSPSSICVEHVLRGLDAQVECPIRAHTQPAATPVSTQQVASPLPVSTPREHPEPADNEGSDAYKEYGTLYRTLAAQLDAIKSVVGSGHEEEAIEFVKEVTNMVAEEIMKQGPSALVAVGSEAGSQLRPGRAMSRAFMQAVATRQEVIVRRATLAKIEHLRKSYIEDLEQGIRGRKRPVEPLHPRGGEQKMEVQPPLARLGATGETTHSDESSSSTGPAQATGQAKKKKRAKKKSPVKPVPSSEAVSAPVVSAPSSGGGGLAEAITPTTTKGSGAPAKDRLIREVSALIERVMQKTETQDFQGGTSVSRAPKCPSKPGKRVNSQAKNSALSDALKPKESSA